MTTSSDLGRLTDDARYQVRQAEAAVKAAAIDLADALASGRTVLPEDKAVSEYRTLRRRERSKQRAWIRARDAYNTEMRRS